MSDIPTCAAPGVARGRGRLRYFRASVALVLASAGIAGCGSSSSHSQTANSTNVANTGTHVTSALASEYQQFSRAQAAISVPALSKRPSSGKSVAVMSCPLPTCANVADPAESAAHALGWHTTLVNSPISPQGYVTAVKQIIQQHPSFAVLIALFPNTFIASELKQLQAAGTKVVEIAGGQTPSVHGPVEGVTSGSPELAESGHLMGVAVAKDAGGAAHTLFVWDPDLASSWRPVQDAFRSVIDGAGGSVSVLDISSADVGTSVPGQIVNYVQAHPDVKYIAFAVSDLAAGVPGALKAAGVANQVKIISRAPNATTMADIRDGLEWTTVGEEVEASGWRSIDQLARLATGVPLGNLINPVGWHEIFTSANLPKASGTPVTPGVPDAFLSAWHVK